LKWDPRITAWASSKNAAALAAFARWLGVQQDLRDALAALENEAWTSSMDGRERFREALAALLDDIDRGHRHGVSVASGCEECSDDAIDVLWRIGCAALGVGFQGCAIEQRYGRPHFFIGEWVTTAAAACGGASGLRSAALRSLVRQLQELAERTRIAPEVAEHQQAMDNARAEVRGQAVKPEEEA
jgi:hypothetical protein